MSLPGVDCSNPISGAALADAGERWCGRYISSIPGPKVATGSELADHRANGVGGLLIMEDTTSDLTLGTDHAVALAGFAVGQAKALGAPAKTAIVMTCDNNDPPASVVVSAASAAAVIRAAGYLAGFYGPKVPARQLAAAGSIDVTFVVDTWGADQPGDAWNFRQLPNSGQTTIGGVTCDIDTADYPVGLWLPAPAASPPLPPAEGTLSEVTMRFPLNINTDGAGNGEAVLNQPWANARGVTPNGSDANNTPIPQVSFSNFGGQIKVELRGGVVNGVELVWVEVAAT